MAARIQPSRGGKPDKLMKAAISLELHREVDGKPYDYPGKVKRLRIVANALVEKAMTGDTAAIREINDRMDGKVPQAITGEEGTEPIAVRFIVENVPRS